MAIFSHKSAQKVSITAWSFIRLFLIAVLFYFAYILRDIIGLVFVAGVFAAAIIPYVDWMQKKHMPRAVSIFLLYLAILSMFFIVIGFLVTPIYNQISDISNKFPAYYDQINASVAVIQGAENVDIGKNIQDVIKNFSGVAGSGLLTAVGKIFGGIVFVVLVLVLIFYMAVQEKAIESLVTTFVPDKYAEEVSELMYRIQGKLGQWLRNIMLLGFIIACLTFLFLLPVMPEYALTLALFAGITELVPYVGPFLGAVPAVFLALGMGSWSIVFYVIIAYVIIQQSENHIIVPQVMKRTVGLNPIISITAVMIGARLGQVFDIGPVVGVLLAIPTTITLIEIIKYWNNKRRKFQENDN